MDSKWDDWTRRYFPSYPPPVIPVPVVPLPVPLPVPMPTPQEIDEFRRLLDRAREYDKKTGQPDCELEEKRKLLKEMAKALGLEDSLNFV